MSAAPYGLPTITTTAISDTTAQTAITGGNITSNGGSTILSRGVVWSTTSQPTISLATKTSDSIGLGNFISKISGLTANTKYYLRAYATNAAGTSYGTEISFTTNNINLLEGLVAYYPFNGNANDSSGNGNHGTAKGVTLTTDRKGLVDRAYQFDGFNEIVIPHSQQLNLISDMTISAWFLSEGPPLFRTAHTIVSKRVSSDPNNIPYLLAINYQYEFLSDYKKPLFVTAT